MWGAMIQRHKVIFVITILFTVMACSNSDETKGTVAIHDDRKDTLVLAVGEEPEGGFDPTTGWGRYGSPLFQSTLLTYDEHFKVKLDLAKAYEVSQDGLEWTVTIRTGVKFSDGESLTADDVVFTYETTKSSDSVIDLSNVARIEKVDGQTIQFTLKQPDSTFIHVLTTIGIVPEHAYDAQYKEKPIGSGPYQFIQWDKGQQIIVEANPYYYKQAPYFKRLTFLFLSEDAAFAAAKAGEVDVVSVPPTFAREQVDGMELVTLESVDNRGIMLPFRQAGEETKEGYPIGNDVTSDVAIRKAINYAIDRKALVEGVLYGFGTPAYTVSDRLPWWNPDTVIEDNNREKAKHLLEEAGWIKNEDGILEKDGLIANFSLLYPANDHVRQSLAIVVADMIRPLGIDVQTEGKSWNELEKLMYAHPVIMGWGSHDPLEMYNIYSSNMQGERSYNANYYSNSTVDLYMERAIRATTQEEANMYWKKAQWDGDTGFSIKGDAAWAWLVNLEHVYLIRDNVKIGKQKIQPHGHGWPVTDFIETWHWKE